MAKTKTSRYDVAEHLRTPEEMAAYLEACFEEANGDAALGCPDKLSDRAFPTVRTGGEEGVSARDGRNWSGRLCFCQHPCLYWQRGALSEKTDARGAAVIETRSGV